MTSPLKNNDSLTLSETWVVYDGECPYCTNYVRLMRLKETIDSVRLIDARGNGPEVTRIIEAGYDLDDGMVFYYNNHFYHGADAINMMAMLSGSSRFINRLNNLIFRSRRRSAFLYPFLRGCRNLTLKLLGRKKISGGKF